MSQVIVSSAGTSGPRGNSVLSGGRPPGASDGIDGDWWINTTVPTSLTIYGPKAGGAWPAGVPFTGTINGIAVSGTPSAGQVPTATSGTAAAWQTPASSLPPNGAATGDLSGTYPGPTVAKVNGVAVSGTPAIGYVPTATGTTAATWQGLPAASTSGAGLVQFDGTATDIQPLGTQAAGASGKAADAAHVHAMPRLDQISAPTAVVALNSQKISGLANGAVATDAAAFGQIPVAGTTAGSYAAGNDSRITGALQTSSVGTATDLVNAGVPAAGSTGRWADAGHVHPDDVSTPADQGLAAWTYDPVLAGQSISISQASFAGRLLMSRIMIRKAFTWTNVLVGFASVDTGAALTNTFIGVYDSTGALKASTADQSATFGASGTAGVKTIPWTAPFTTSPGAYYLTLLINGTWTSGLTLKGTSAGLTTNAGMTAPYRLGTLLTAQTSIPGSVTLTSMSQSLLASGVCSWWYGAS